VNPLDPGKILDVALLAGHHEPDRDQPGASPFLKSGTAGRQFQLAAPRWLIARAPRILLAGLYLSHAAATRTEVPPGEADEGEAGRRTLRPRRRLPEELDLEPALEAVIEKAALGLLGPSVKACRHQGLAGEIDE
jgi:hypothetical protein